MTRREKQLFFEALTLLLLSQLAVKTIAFRYIYSFLHARWHDNFPDTLDRPDDIMLINLSLSRAANRLPWKSLCLSRSIAAFIMLRRRGIPTVMFAGVKFEECLLHAHAWVHAGLGVIDGDPENAAFTALMRLGHEPVDC